MRELTESKFPNTKKILVFLLVFFPIIVFSQSVNDSTYQKNTVRDIFPSFYSIVADRLAYPLSWLSGNYNDFNVWQSTARDKVMECLLKPPLQISFQPIVIDEQDRGSYTARKIVFNLTADSRVLGYLLVPKGKGPFPAVMILNDHGARFDIGKEKTVMPFADTKERMKSAREWVNKLYGGRFIGDELAKRGYVVFATDALNWSDRGGFKNKDIQQKLGANLLNLGMSYAGLIAWEDMYAAEFLATRPEVDSTRVVAMGLSMGGFRAWQVAALSDRIAGGAAICWMVTRKGEMTTGRQSAFTMTHPNIANYLDFPDVASIACPKPMLFYNGSQDILFPVPSVQESYSIMRKVWESKIAGDKLVTKLWNAGHIFNLEMQNEAFEWLDKVCRK